MPDLVTLRQNRAKVYDKMEAVIAAEESETRQADFDAAAAEVEALDKEIANAERLQKLRGERARGTPESEGLDSVPAQGFMAKYRNLPAAYHEVPSGKALSPAQRAAFGDMLSAVMRAAHHRGVDERLIEASLGSNESVEADGGFLVEKDIADGLLRRTFEVSRIGGRVRRIPPLDHLLARAEVALGDNVAARNWVFAPNRDLYDITPAEAVQYKALATGVREKLEEEAVRRPEEARSEQPTPGRRGANELPGSVARA